MLKSKLSLASLVAMSGGLIAAMQGHPSVQVPPQRNHGTHRTTSNTRLGRSLISPSSTYRGNSDPRYLHSMITSSPAEIAAHNKMIEQRKKDKILLKAARLAQQRNAWNNRKLAVPDLGPERNQIAYGTAEI